MWDFSTDRENREDEKEADAVINPQGTRRMHERRDGEKIGQISNFTRSSYAHSGERGVPFAMEIRILKATTQLESRKYYDSFVSKETKEIGIIDYRPSLCR